MADTLAAGPPITDPAPEYSLWLLPERAMQERMAALVATLAPRFATRAFPPHVTVQGDLRHRLKDMTAAATALAQGMAVQRVRVRGIEQSMHYYRAFYLAFDGFEAFAPLVQRSAQRFGTEHGLSPFPHLSLAYGTLGSDAKDRLATEFAAHVPLEMVFDRLAISLSGDGVGIASWRVLQTFALAPSAPAIQGESSP
jgi:2'-5' RNA ligase